jgi:hypothetical protein
MAKLTDKELTNVLKGLTVEELRIVEKLQDLIVNDAPADVLKDELQTNPEIFRLFVMLAKAEISKDLN